LYRRFVQIDCFDTDWQHKYPLLRKNYVCRPEITWNILTNLSPNPAGEIRPDLQLWVTCQNSTGAYISSRMGNCAVPPDHLHSETSFSRTCNIPEHCKSTKTRRSYLNYMGAFLYFILIIEKVCNSFRIPLTKLFMFTEINFSSVKNFLRWNTGANSISRERSCKQYFLIVHLTVNLLVKGRDLQKFSHSSQISKCKFSLCVGLPLIFPWSHVQKQYIITLVSDAQREGKVSVTLKSWLPRNNRKTYYNTFAASAKLAYGQPSQDLPKNICDQPIQIGE